MADHAFDQMLEQYFLRGKHDKEETLHLVSRFRGGGNLLHSCIKEGYLDTLRLLLDEFTPESQPGARWRALAEPLRPVGLHKCSAFHRAVFDGRSDCLAELVFWAKRHGHDITELRNVEERDIAGSQRGLTCLELSEQEGNLACYNVLAPLFGVPKKECATDAQPRETRMAERTMARVELASARSEHTLQLRPMTLQSPRLTWEAVLDSVRDLKASDVYRGRDPSEMVLRLENLVFVDDPSEEQVDQLLAESSGMAALEANSCIWKTEKTALGFLAVVVGRLEMEASSRLPRRMPLKVHVSSPTAEDIPIEEEDQTDRQVVALLLRFAAACGKWPHFLGARNGMISRMQAMRLASRDTQSHAATIAAIYATRLNSFVGHLPSDFDDEGLGEWLRKQELMPLARAVFSHFYNLDKLLAQEPEDVSQAMEFAVVPFLKMSLSAWFATVPTASADLDLWRAWSEALGSDEEVLKKQLAPALDFVLEAILRMQKALDPVCKQTSRLTQVASLGELVRSCVPEGLFPRLPLTQARLERHWPIKPAQAPKKKLSLLMQTSALKPCTGPGYASSGGQGFTKFMTETSPRDKQRSLAAGCT